MNEDGEMDVKRLLDFFFRQICIDRKEIIKNKRKTLVMTISEKLYERLVRLNEIVVSKNRMRYPMSFLIEDMLTWILSDKERLLEFLTESYDLEDVISGEPADEEEARKQRIVYIPIFRSPRNPQRRRRKKSKDEVH